LRCRGVRLGSICRDVFAFLKDNSEELYNELLSEIGPKKRRRPRRIIAPPIPAWCRIIAEFRYFDEAREHALRLKRERPQRILGYDFNPQTGLWAVLECDRLPPGIETDKDGLFMLPPLGE